MRRTVRRDRAAGLPTAIWLAVVPGIALAGTLGDCAAGHFAVSGRGPDAVDVGSRWSVQFDREASFSVARTVGVGGEPLQLVIVLPPELLIRLESVPGPVFLMFRGVPTEISFSTGFRLRDAWAVSVKDVPLLRLLSPAGFEGSLTLRASLYLGSDAPPRTRSFTVEFARRVETALAAPAPAGISASPVPGAGVDPAFGQPRPARTGLNAEQENDLLARAEKLLRHGDFEAARLIYGELAERGSPQAAYRMAQSFDPEVLQRFFIVGIAPDLGQARTWYGRAAALGAIGARERLRQLAEGGAD